MANYTTTFMERSTKKHGTYYDYSKLPPQFTYNEWVPIICPIHGEFTQKARTHASGSQCPSCGKEARYKNRRHTVEDFIKRARQTHGDKYDYSQSVYNGQMKEINIICPIHGKFTQIANNHIHGNGCARCSDSRGEREIKLILDELQIIYEQQKTFQDCKNFGRKKPNVLPFDFYVPSLRLLIEYDGKHHFEPVAFNGVSNTKAVDLHQRTKENDEVKTQYAIDNGYELLRISYMDDIADALQQII